MGVVGGEKGAVRPLGDGFRVGGSRVERGYG